jgi:molybdopterin-guanine dinucleotide biosynthesis protein A
LEASGIILAGGRSLRLGYDKILETVGSRSLLEIVVDSITSLCGDIIIVTAEGRSISPPGHHPGMQIVTDIYAGKGPLGGIYTGLHISNTYCNLVVAADMPFLNRELLHYMIELIDGYDIVTPRVEGKVEPLHSVYTRDCLKVIEQMFERDELGVHKLLPLVNARYVEVDEIVRFDPEQLSFFNVNTEKDLQKARKLSGGDKDGD